MVNQSKPDIRYDIVDCRILDSKEVRPSQMESQWEIWHNFISFSLLRIGSIYGHNQPIFTIFSSLHMANTASFLSKNHKWNKIDKNLPVW